MRFIINRWVITNFKYSYATMKKKPYVLFPEDQEIRRKKVSFVNSEDWTPIRYSVLCTDHLAKKK